MGTKGRKAMDGIEEMRAAHARAELAAMFLEDADLKKSDVEKFIEKCGKRRTREPAFLLCAGCRKVTLHRFLRNKKCMVIVERYVSGKPIERVVEAGEEMYMCSGCGVERRWGITE